MKPLVTPVRRFSAALLRYGALLLPQGPIDWAGAMRAELEHLDRDRDALLWAIGCVWAAAKERVITMLTGNLRISRWLLGPEMLLCFVPLTFGWLGGIAGNFGIGHLNSQVLHEYFIGVPGGIPALITVVGFATLGSVGPVGLAVAFRLIVVQRPLRRRWLAASLVAGSLAFGALIVGCRWAIEGLQGFSLASVDAFDFWGGVLLLSALPAAGAAHMLRLSPTRAAAMPA